MKIAILLFVFALISPQGVISQNTFFIGEKTYSSTDSYELRSGWHAKLKVLFIKDGEKGMIAVTTYALGSQRIKGKLMIYLEDNTIITCIDRNKFDIVNSEATTIYYLTKEEINRLKSTNIASIRYSVGCVNCGGFLDSSSNYSVKNSVEYPWQKKIDFPSEIRELFDY